MSLFYLVRHGSTDAIGRALTGRSPGVRLNALGRQESAAAAEFLARQSVQHIHSSPLERARESAQPLAEKLGVQVHVSEDLNEVHFGEWTGSSFPQIEEMEGWKQWNLFRAGARPPGGETMLDVQARVVRHILDTAKEHPDGRIAVFSHGDAIRAALMFWLGMSMDSVFRIEVSPGSISTVELTPWNALVKGVNWRP